MFLSAVKIQLFFARILSRLKLNCHEKIEESFFSKAFLKLLRKTLQIFGWLQLKTIIILGKGQNVENHFVESQKKNIESVKV
jgi:hypothetical protein